MPGVGDRAYDREKSEGIVKDEEQLRLKSIMMDLNHVFHIIA